MSLSTLAVSPEQSSLSSDHTAGAISAKFDGGRSNFRSAPRGSMIRVSATFSLSQTGFTYFMAFYRAKTKRSSEPFYIKSPVAASSLPLHKAWIVPASLKIKMIGGQRYRVSVQLEIEQ